MATPLGVSFAAVFTISLFGLPLQNSSTQKHHYGQRNGFCLLLKAPHKKPIIANAEQMHNAILRKKINRKNRHNAKQWKCKKTRKELPFTPRIIKKYKNSNSCDRPTTRASFSPFLVFSCSMIQVFQPRTRDGCRVQPWHCCSLEYKYTIIVPNTFSNGTFHS